MVFITETSAFFIPDLALFGAFPTQQQISQLETWDVKLIVNLTSDYEKKIKPYTTNCKVIQYSIPDRGVPTNPKTFYALVVYIASVIEKKEKVYIHCKGGHGRSSLLVCVLLCFLYKISPEDAFIKTSEYHASRLVHSMKPKKDEYWKNKGFPQTTEQKKFIYTTFQQYKIPENSPFQKINIWISGNYDEYLLDTGLGCIQGQNGTFLEKYRNEILKTKACFLFSNVEFGAHKISKQILN